MTRLASVRDVLADLLDAFIEDVLHVLMEDARSRAPKPVAKKPVAKKVVAKATRAKKAIATTAKAGGPRKPGRPRRESEPPSRRESAPPSRRGKAPKVRAVPMAGEIMDPEALLGGAAVTPVSAP